MPQSVPTPLAAALGLVPTVLGGVRRLPGKAVQLPVLAVGSALTRMDAARREYLELADRGERLVAKLRGTSFDELEDRVEDALQGTPLARPYDAVEDALEDAGEAVAGSVSQLTSRVAQRTQKVAETAERTVDKAAEATADTAGRTADAVQETADKAEKATRKATAKAEKATAKATSKAASKAADKAGKASAKAAKADDKADDKAAGTADDTAAATSTDAKPQDEVPEAEQPKGAPTPTATQPDSSRIDTAASADVVETVEQVTAKAVAPEVVDHDQLPLADYDHMTLGSLRGRLRSLDLDQLVQVRNYEKAHADRLPVVTMLDNRIAKLAAAPASEQPSGVPSDRPAPGQGDTPAGSTVTPATGGPALNPPSQGVPTNPAQPRTTGSPGTNPSSNA